MIINTVDDAIKAFEITIDEEKSKIQAQDGLPGLYYDPRVVERCNESIKECNRVISWLKDYKRLLNNEKVIEKNKAIEKKVIDKKKKKKKRIQKIKEFKIFNIRVIIYKTIRRTKFNGQIS